jgi:hypothetical protein
MGESKVVGRLPFGTKQAGAKHTEAEFLQSIERGVDLDGGDVVGVAALHDFQSLQAVDP